MAQFTPQGRLKLLFHGDGVEPKDPFHYKLVSNVFGGSGGLKSLQTHKGMLRFLGSTTRRSHFSSSLKKGSKFNATASLNVSDEGLYDEEDYDSEFGTDELSCFRGLVLDISYRYCSARDNLTIDHVLPVARGGEWKWENLVAACAECNSKKGRKTLEEANMKLIKVPKAPKDYDILAIPLTSAAIMMLRKRNGTPEEWRQYLSSSIEP
ncbi:hypothetical protein ERO13_D11G268200v2 [Gossypium hirsutum]|uniref:HNH nuclease domain-containing protein n=4 Tax=Gossypium TaxID=3633 RepID=A0A0D2TND0_GOSRA|nr:hypothetical protein ES319_D11G292600v1 [Gossypium barbadense]KAG4122454.1 hypothetical protein ERO13_D11G268200v2 [Gossypium hirsutum]KJB45065.1 hypothetical protein B456_007G287900 [Gossypium raimondii]TYG47074.1 hypothetical protein ES288_D11G308900v1 [Gossypium darwinii]TYH46091.1 hypothetical protein ES332_D11G311400v1 [Gossypium tomentosum]